VQLELVGVLVLQDAITCVEWRYAYASSVFENVIRQRVQRHRPGPGTAEVLECQRVDDVDGFGAPASCPARFPDHLRVRRCSGYTTPDPGLNSHRTSAIHTTSNPLLPFLLLCWMSIEANHSLPYPYRSKTCAVYAPAPVPHPTFISSLSVILRFFLLRLTCGAARYQPNPTHFPYTHHTAYGVQHLKYSSQHRFTPYLEPIHPLHTSHPSSSFLITLSPVPSSHDTCTPSLIYAATQ